MTETERPGVCIESGVVVDEEDDIKGGDDVIADDGMEVGLNMNNACLKPGLNNQS